jgi:hypothetical protein
LPGALPLKATAMLTLTVLSLLVDALILAIRRSLR